MTTIDPAGYSEAGAHLFTWLADKVLGGAKKAFGWGWTQVEWAKAQDRYDARIIQDYGQIRIANQTTDAFPRRRPDDEMAIHECLRRSRTFGEQSRRHAQDRRPRMRSRILE